MMKPSSDFEHAIERATGHSIEWLRSTPVDEQRRVFEREMGRRMTCVRRFPLIGRSSLPNVITHEEVEALLNWALRPIR